MRTGCGHSVLAYAKIVLLVISVVQDVYAHPRSQRHPDSAALENSEDHPEQLSSHTLERYPRSPGSYYGAVKSSRKLQDQDEIAQLIERAIEEGDLMNEEEWNNHRRSPSRSVQRDIARADTPYTSRFSQTQGHPGQPGQRRLFADQRSSSSMESMQSDGGIVFPDEKVPSRILTPTPRTVPRCNGSTFCLNADGYPKDIVDTAIRQNSSLKLLENVDVLYDTMTGADVAQRVDIQDEVLCSYTERIIFPITAENEEMQWQYIVNQDDFKQSVQVEICNNENAACSVVDGLPEGYKTSCKQKYVYRQLVAITNGTLTKNKFKFPSSCCCHAKLVGNTSLRLGVSARQQKSQTTPATT